jgi:hypothetical protein
MAGSFEFVQVTYTPRASEDYEHNIGAAPAYQFALWRRLPKFLQSRISYPNTGIGYQGSDHPFISIWWAYIDPKTGKPELGPSGYALMILDDGEVRKAGWPHGTDEGFRQIFITDPPTTSKRLRFRLSAEEQSVEFSIENPAYRK